MKKIKFSDNKKSEEQIVRDFFNQAIKKLDIGLKKIHKKYPGLKKQGE